MCSTKTLWRGTARKTKEKTRKKVKQFLLNIGFSYMWIALMMILGSFSVSAATIISCNGDPPHSCSAYNSISSISVSAPSSANAGSVINVRVDWIGWHWYDPNHFAIFMKPIVGGSWELIDSCTTWVSDSGTNRYTMNCPITIPSRYSGNYYIRVTGNDYNGYCNPGESGVDAEGQTTITVNGCITLTPGVTVIGNEDRCYKYSHAGGSAWITLTMNLSADYDLYTKWDGTIPSESNWDCRPFYGRWITEICKKDTLNSGEYYVYVKKYSGSGEFQIRYDTSTSGLISCVDYSWSPTYWTSLQERMRNSSDVGFLQYFMWNDASLTALKQKSTAVSNYQHEIRRPDNPDFWDWLRAGDWWTCYGYGWTNLPNPDWWGTEERDYPWVCPYPWNNQNEEFQVNCQDIFALQPNKWYGVYAIFKRRTNLGTIFDVQTESEFCGNRRTLCDLGGSFELCRLTNEKEVS